MTRSSDIQKEIARLMRDPNALRSGREALQPSGGHDHYDPNQPRVPAGDPRGGQWMSGGSRGGASDREARVRLGSLDAAQLAQVGQGSPRDAQAQPFEGQLGNIGAGQHLSSQSAFEQIDIDRQRRRDERYDFQTGRYRFLSTGPYAREPIPGGTRWVISSTTYAYDDITGAYATISATPARPIIIDSYYGRLVVTPVNPAIRGR
jgi:hypothetical protein